MPEQENEITRRPEGDLSRGHSRTDIEPRHDDAEHGAAKMDLPPLGTFPVLVMAGVFVALLIGLFVVGYLPHRARLAQIEEEAAKKTDARPVVNVVVPKQQKAVPSLQLPGTARAFQMTNIYPRSNGYLKKRYADIGDRVTAGQLLAEIETPEIDAQYNAAQATLEQARANATRAKSDYELAEVTLKRYEGFASTGGVTQQQIDEKRSAFEQAKSQRDVADATVKGEEAEVQRLAALQGFQKVFAPFDGTVTARNFDVGALLSASNGGGGELFRIEQTDVLRVSVDVPQSYVDQVKPGQDAEFVVRNFENKPFKGKIARSTGALDPTTRTLRVEADFPNPDGGLLPGMYGQVRYSLVRNNLPLTVPSSALVFGPQGTRLAVLNDQQQVSFKAIRVGRDLGTELEIASGLDGKERVIANPGERLTDGMTVDIAAPPPGPQVAERPASPQPGAGGTAGDITAAQPAVRGTNAQ